MPDILDSLIFGSLAGQGGGGGGGTTNYNQLSNRPKINDVTLTGNKTAGDLGLADAEDVQDLQEQIDAITSSTDVRDVVADYAALLAYDTSVLFDKDIVKVLSDSTHLSATAYYRWVITEGVGAWSYVGSEGPYYTKSQTDTAIATAVSTATTGLPKDVLVNGTSVVDENGDADIPAIPELDYGVWEFGKAADASLVAGAVGQINGEWDGSFDTTVVWNTHNYAQEPITGTRTLTIGGFPVENVASRTIHIMFEAGANCSVTLIADGEVHEDILWANGEQPTYIAGHIYEIVLSDGVGAHIYASYTEYTPD